MEGISRNKDTMYTGRTREYKLVNFPCDEDLTGKLVKVKIVKSRPFWLEGAVIPEEKFHETYTHDAAIHRHKGAI